MNRSAMNGEVDQCDNEGNHEEQGGDAHAISQAENYHPNDDQNSEECFQHVAPPRPNGLLAVNAFKMMAVPQGKRWSI